MEKSPIFVTTDLGFGDAAKGSTVHYLADLVKAGTVVRTGGCQALHNVITSYGIHHCHVHFGSGTFAGAGTYLSKHMIVDPFTLFGEANALQKMLGPWVYEQLAVDQDCLVVTPWHKICNRLRELSRGDNHHGSVGVGIGEAKFDLLTSSDLSLYVRDFGQNYLVEKLAHIRQYKISQIKGFLDQIDTKSEVAAKELEFLYRESIITGTAQTYLGLTKDVKIVDENYLDTIVQQSRPIIFEPSQGVLLDEDYGFYPYNTFVNTTSSDALSLIAKHGYQPQVIRLGLTRAYQHRHGAGPFVTEDKTLTSLLADQHNEFHPWQKGWRVGHLDMIMLRYAIEVCGGQKEFQGLVVSCLDRVYQRELPLKLCYGYQYIGNDSNLDEFFYIKNGLISGIKVYLGSDIINHQEKLTLLLKDCRPILSDVSQLASDDINGYLNLIENHLGIDITIGSFGPTEVDKILRGAGKKYSWSRTVF